MATVSLQQFGEVFRTSAELSDAVSRAVRDGRARKLHGRLYTTNMVEQPDAIIRRNLWRVVSLLFPGTVVSHRTALEMRPTPGGTVFLTGPSNRLVELPGLRVRLLMGPGQLPGDAPFIQDLLKASEARALLECLKLRQVRGAESPGLPRPEIERRLERITLRGGDALNRLRDAAREIAPELKAEAAFEEMNALIGTLLGTRSVSLQDPAARAQAAGSPYDPGRLQLFQLLLEALAEWPSVSRPDEVRQGPAWEHLAFFDAYFSNFIEGTEFRVEEAVEIVFEHRIPEARPEDAHDVLGTYALVANSQEMGQSALRFAQEPDGFLELLKQRHRVIMQARPDKRPGQFKLKGNQAGNTYFVEPDRVEGTLRQGFELFRSLTDPFHRAAFMMFLLTEVHPFDDGNGRTARAFMNAELISGGERRILIPIVYRQDYILSLKALSQTDRPRPLIRMLDRAQAFAAGIDFGDFEEAIRRLHQARAFDTNEDALLRD
jgi:fido (protein-threonine AMPylation protein)